VGCDRLPSDAVRQIRQGHGAYQRGDYAGAQQILSPVISRHAGHSDVAEAQYIRGLARVKSDQTEAAQRDFQAALGVAVRPELKGSLYAQLGNLEYEAGRYEAAASQYRRAEPHLDDEPPSDRILLRYGLSLQRCGRFRHAKVVLLDLLDRFPNGPAAAEARRALSHVGNHYSIQCGVYRQQANAKATAGKLRRHGFDASAWRETTNGSRRFVVRSGKYPRRGQAERDLPRIRRIIPDAFVVP
jgi:outer membrane protein assembly factor BamD (BamD/ComL family)